MDRDVSLQVLVGGHSPRLRALVIEIRPIATWWQFGFCIFLFVEHLRFPSCITHEMSLPCSAPKKLSKGVRGMGV